MKKPLILFPECSKKPEKKTSIIGTCSGLLDPSEVMIEDFFQSPEMTKNNLITALISLIKIVSIKLKKQFTSKLNKN